MAHRSYALLRARLLCSRSHALQDASHDRVVESQALRAQASNQIARSTRLAASLANRHADDREDGRRDALMS
jgi:hypothetical protein